MEEKEEKKNPALGKPDEAEGKADKPPKAQHYSRENLYGHIDLSVRQMDIIIAVLAILLALAVIVGVIVK
jgi:hypothetical protein